MAKLAQPVEQVSAVRADTPSDIVQVHNSTHCRPFFDLCDGIFLNYNWTESGLAGSHDLAGDRRGEVYVGVDVFGRGCYGGGGFNSCKVPTSVSGS